MRRVIGAMKARQVEALPTGFHSDGGNLYLRVKDTGARSWVFRYKQIGKVRELGLGPTHTRALADARHVADAMRRAVQDGRDPASVLLKKDPTRATFQTCAEELIEAKRAGWRSDKHALQWTATLKAYAFPHIGNKAPADVSLIDIKTILLPIWSKKTETATRLRQRIESVLDYAAVHGLCDVGRNPARWKGTLDKVLPKPEKVRTVEHHAAAAYADVPRIMAALRGKDHVSALCLRFIVLTACRSGEGRGASWSEVDLDAKLWTIPATRMKAGKAHRIALQDEAVEILRAMFKRKRPRSDLVFPGARDGLVSDVAVNKTLHSIATGITVHGFRSAFRDWAAEQTSFPSRVCELCLAHGNPDKVEAAYQRSDLFEKRRELLDAWGAYCKVLPKPQVPQQDEEPSDPPA